MVWHSLESYKPRKFKCGNNLHRVRVFPEVFLKGLECEFPNWVFFKLWVVTWGSGNHFGESWPDFFLMKYNEIKWTIAECITGSQHIMYFFVRIVIQESLKHIALSLGLWEVALRLWFSSISHCWRWSSILLGMENMVQLSHPWRNHPSSFCCVCFYGAVFYLEIQANIYVVQAQYQATETHDQHLILT